MPAARKTILVIDDEPQIRRVVKHALADDNTRLLEADSARAGLDLAAAERPDLIVLDLGLPDGSGEDVCRELRGWTRAPILVLSARHSDTEKVALFDAGGDDYVTKPFSPAELTARVRALLRRAAAAAPDGATKIVRDELEIDLERRAVKLDGSPVHLTPIEWGLLTALATNPGRVMTHHQLFAAVWRGRDHGDAQQYLRVYVAHLRRKLEKDPVHPRFIFTIPAVGYRFGA
ncbi:MAG TPA: response regulator transcription factor [Gemmatimonadaceae bacterium]|jgi:two-component system KDP operon response regulator KdpE